MPAHIGYYSMHDPITGKVGWAPHSNSVKGDVFVGPVPSGDKVLTIGKLGKSVVEILLEYFLTLSIFSLCLRLFWKKVYPELESSYSTNEVKAYSGAYFLGVFMGTFYIIVPFFEWYYERDYPEPQETSHSSS